MPKSVEKRTGASPTTTSYAFIRTDHHTRRFMHAITQAVAQIITHLTTRTTQTRHTRHHTRHHIKHASPCKCATQTRHTLTAAQTHHTHCYACHRTRTITRARHHTSITQSANSHHATKSHTRSHTHRESHTEPQAESQTSPPPTPSKISIHPPFLVAYSRLPDRNTKNSTTSACL